MPAAIPLAISAGTSIFGGIMNKKAQDKQTNALNQQIAAQQAMGGGGFSSTPNAFAMNALADFSKTGGFSPEDLQNIRARALSPVRATYANAEREVNRQRAIQGGYSPGFNVLQGRMAREQGQASSDAATNAEASIAQMVQQGKLAALQDMAAYGRSESSGGGAGFQAQPQQSGGWMDTIGNIAKTISPVLLNKYGGAGGGGGLLPSKSFGGNIGTLPGLPNPNVSSSMGIPGMAGTIPALEGSNPSQYLPGFGG